MRYLQIEIPESSIVRLPSPASIVRVALNFVGREGAAEYIEVSQVTGVQISIVEISPHLACGR